MPLKNTARTGFVAALFLVSLPLVGSAATQVICVTKTGALTVRNKCKKSETKAVLATFVGQTGPTGATGATGPGGVLNRVAVFSATSPTLVLGGATQAITHTQACPVGQVTVGGGCIDSSNKLSLSSSYPFDANPQEWRCTYINNTSSVQSSSITTLAICADPQ